MSGASVAETQPAQRTRILVVEDEPEFADLLALWIDRSGWEPATIHDGDHVAEALRSSSPDLVVLDVGLPGIDGWQVLRQIRASSAIPVVLVTASGSEADKVRGLRLGADDYITKPLSFPELMARIEAALRRAGHGVYASRVRRAVRCGPLTVDEDGHRVEVGGIEVHVTPTEFRLLQCLAERAGEVVKHRELLETAWGPGYAEETHLLQVAIGSLRAKIEVVTSEPLIATVYGLGYRIATEG